MIKRDGPNYSDQLAIKYDQTSRLTVGISFLVNRQYHRPALTSLSRAPRAVAQEIVQQPAKTGQV